MKKSAKKKTSLYKKVDSVEVYIWGDFVGAVALDPKLGFYVFAYDKKFAQKRVELSPIYMPLRDNEEPYVFTDLPVDTYKRLPAMLADSLPDDFGNALIDQYMSSKGIPKQMVTALDRLAYMSKRSMGALEFKPARGPRTQKSFAIEMSSLVTAARQAVDGQIDNDHNSLAALRNIIEVGTSAGGARAKAVIAWNRATNQIKSGQVEVPDGFEHWLLKFDGMGKDRELGSSEEYGRIEYAYYLMATSAGIQMSESRLLEEHGRAHFMTKRFDRESGKMKHHVQTLCAIAHLDYKKKSTNTYEQLFETIEALNLGYEAKAEAFRRMVFNIVAKNCDDHTKNFSFILKQGHVWELSPAYDVTFAHNPQGEWTHQHLMSVNGKFMEVNLTDLAIISERFGVGDYKEIIKAVNDSVRRWEHFAKEANISTKDVERIKKMHSLL